MAAIDLAVYTPNERRVTAAFDKLPPELIERLRGPLDALAQRLLARVHAAEPEKTGLLREDTREFVDVHGNAITARVRVLPDPGQKFNLKAQSLEYGAHAVAHVKAHDMMLDHFMSHAMAPQEVLVKAYDRHVNIPELAFVRGSFAGVPQEFKDAVEQVMAEMAKAFGG